MRQPATDEAEVCSRFAFHGTRPAFDGVEAALQMETTLAHWRSQLDAAYRGELVLLIDHHGQIHTFRPGTGGGL